MISALCPPRVGVACAVWLVLGLAARISPARADIPPDPPFIIHDVLVCPDGSLPYHVTYTPPTGPVPNLLVEIRYTPAADAAACWCPGQAHPTITALTNSSGVATFHIAGGLCLNPATFPGGLVAEVWVDGIKCKEVGQISPEVVPAPHCEVTLNSAVDFSHFLATGDYGYCYDLNSNGSVTLSDAIIFTPPAANAAHCQ